MKIAVTGATGFIGQCLCNLLGENHEVIALTRNPEKARNLFNESTQLSRFNSNQLDGWEDCIKDADTVINLAGTNIAAGRWSAKLKQQIIASRINSSRILLEAIKKTGSKFNTFIISSAVGFYGSRTDEDLDEESSIGQGFLAEVCSKNEAIAEDLKARGLRTIILRSGVVLDSSGGALKKMALPFKLFIGGPIAGGRQWMSWISLADEVGAIKFLIENQLCNGIYNLTSPCPVTNREFSKILAKTLKRPCIFPVPALALKIIFGRMADELFLSSQKVYPARLIESGFTFKQPNITEALQSMY